jgi:HD domain-containing protein
VYTLAANVSQLVSRTRIQLAIHGAAAAALVPALIWLAPDSRWNRPGLLAVLLVLAVIADFNEVPLKNGLRFDAGMPLALITLAILGPLPALLVDWTPIAVGGLIRREKIIRQGNLANVAAYGWETVAATCLLAAAGVTGLGFEALPWLLLTGFVMYWVNGLVGPGIYVPLYVGAPVSVLPRLYIDALPAGLLMITLAAMTTVLVGPLGVAALAIFALIAIVPQSALMYASLTRPVARLDPLTATRRYSQAMALHLGLDRHERRHLARVTELAFERRADAGDPIAYARQTIRDPSRASWEAGHVAEWWNGGGGPAGLRGPVTPVTSRIVAVADTWSALTAKGGPRLSHAEALIELENAAGTRFDPRVVQAAHAVVAEERVSETEPAPEPRLHSLRLPAQLRRAMADA